MLLLHDFTITQCDDADCCDFPRYQTHMMGGKPYSCSQPTDPRPRASSCHAQLKTRCASSALPASSSPLWTQLACTITWRLSRQMAASLLQQLLHRMSRLVLQGMLCAGGCCTDFYSGARCACVLCISCLCALHSLDCMQFDLSFSARTGSLLLYKRLALCVQKQNALLCLVPGAVRLKPELQACVVLISC